MMTLDEFEAFVGRKAKPSEILKNQLTEESPGREFQRVEDDEEVTPVMDGYLMKCCDCGLVHELSFRALRVTSREGAAFSAKELDPTKFRVVLKARRIDAQ